MVECRAGGQIRDLTVGSQRFYYAAPIMLSECRETVPYLYKIYFFTEIFTKNILIIKQPEKYNHYFQFYLEFRKINFDCSGLNYSLLNNQSANVKADSKKNIIFTYG